MCTPYLVVQDKEQKDRLRLFPSSPAKQGASSYCTHAQLNRGHCTYVICTSIDEDVIYRPIKMAFVNQSQNLLACCLMVLQHARRSRKTACKSFLILGAHQLFSSLVLLALPYRQVTMTTS